MPRDDTRGFPSSPGALDLSDYDGLYDYDPDPVPGYEPAPVYRLPKWAVRWVVTLSVLVFGAILVSGSVGTGGLLCGSLWLATAGIFSILWALEG